MNSTKLDYIIISFPSSTWPPSRYLQLFHLPDLSSNRWRSRESGIRSTFEMTRFLVFFLLFFWAPRTHRRQSSSFLMFCQDSSNQVEPAKIHTTTREKDDLSFHIIFQEHFGWCFHQRRANEKKNVSNRRACQRQRRNLNKVWINFNEKSRIERHAFARLHLSPRGKARAEHMKNPLFLETHPKSDDGVLLRILAGSAGTKERERR